MSTTGFYVSAFGIDGEIEGSGLHDYVDLSRKWLEKCKMFLSQHGDNFDAAWEGPLCHIRTKLSASGGIALLTISSHGIPANSVFLSDGSRPDRESSVMKMFINSLRGVELVRRAANTAEPFEGLLSLTSRPLMAVVPWPNEEISDDDQLLISELCLHISAAFFSK